MAEWSDFDLEAGLWTVPAARMKSGRVHRVPLVPRAVEILATLVPAAERHGLVFPGARRGHPMSDMTMASVLKRMKLAEFTVHGFRSTFRDWAGDRTHFPRELAEAALAHVVGDSTERAYRRSDALERRRELMLAWAAWCEPKADNVVELEDSRMIDHPRQRRLRFKTDNVSLDSFRLLRRIGCNRNQVGKHLPTSDAGRAIVTLFPGVRVTHRTIAEGQGDNMVALTAQTGKCFLITNVCNLETLPDQPWSGTRAARHRGGLPRRS